MELLTPLAAVRKTPEIVLWALAIFVCGVVVLPVLHLADHRHDHHHGGGVAHLQAHVEGTAHDHPAGDEWGHGAGALAHFGVALLGVEAPRLLQPVEALVFAAEARARSAPLLRHRLTPIRPGAP